MFSLIYLKKNHKTPFIEGFYSLILNTFTEFSEVLGVKPTPLTFW